MFLKHLPLTCKNTENHFRVNQLHSTEPFLPRYQCFLRRGLAAMESRPSETGTISALEGPSFPGLGVESLFPTLNQRREGRAETQRLWIQSGTRRVCGSGTVSADSSHCWGSSGWGHTALGCKSSPGSSSSRHWTSPAPHLGRRNKLNIYNNVQCSLILPARSFDMSLTWAGARICVFGTGEFRGDFSGNFSQCLLQVGAICRCHHRH